MHLKIILLTIPRCFKKDFNLINHRKINADIVVKTAFQLTSYFWHDNPLINL